MAQPPGWLPYYSAVIHFLEKTEDTFGINKLCLFFFFLLLLFFFFFSSLFAVNGFFFKEINEGTWRDLFQ
jgi:hypothetical protein